MQTKPNSLENRNDKLVTIFAYYIDNLDFLWLRIASAGFGIFKNSVLGIDSSRTNPTWSAI
jgi:hypothetical protein